MDRLILLALLPLATACCTSGTNVKTAARPPEPDRMAGAEAATETPLLARWRVLSDTGGRLRIAAVLDRRASFDVPINVQVQLPSGLHLISGQTSFQVAPNTRPDETSATLEFAYTSIPADDLKLVAHVGGNAMGVHATDSYRFGRPEPEPVRPQRSGPNVKVGGTDLGPAIQIDKK